MWTTVLALASLLAPSEKVTFGTADGLQLVADFHDLEGDTPRSLLLVGPSGVWVGADPRGVFARLAVFHTELPDPERHGYIMPRIVDGGQWLVDSGVASWRRGRGLLRRFRAGARGRCRLTRRGGGCG